MSSPANSPSSLPSLTALHEEPDPGPDELTVMLDQEHLDILCSFAAEKGISRPRALLHVIRRARASTKLTGQ